MSKNGQKSFLDKATEHLYPDIIKDNQTNIKNSFIHASTVNISRLLDLFGLDKDNSPGLMKKSTWAGSIREMSLEVSLERNSYFWCSHFSCLLL